MLETYRCHIIPLSPIHVGTGDIMCPGEYFVFPNESDSIYACDLSLIPPQEMGALRDKLIRWITENPLTWPSNVTADHHVSALIKKYAKFQCRTTKSCFEGIMKRWGKGMSELAISTVYRTIKGAVIPGSTIKGALRTALVYRKAKKPVSVTAEDARRAPEWERRILLPGSKGGIQEDLLSTLKVSDTAPTTITTWVVQPTHIGMAPEAQQMQDYMECLPQANLEKPYKLQFTISIVPRKLGMQGGKQAVSIKEIIDACRKFYDDVLEEEIAFWQEGNTKEDKSALSHCDKVRQVAGRNANSALIRLGRGCGMNSLSINIAKPEGTHPRRGIDPRYRYYPNTRVLLSSMPPGWALLTVES